MKIFRLLLIVSLFSLFLTSVYSQDAGVGQWRDHLPYNSFIAVTEAEDIIYGATPFAVLTYNKTDESIERYTKINGLSDIGISDIKYSTDMKTVVLAYTNTNLDLFKGNAIINVPDIKRKQILGNKVINKITLRENFAYLSCGFGIVVLDIDREEVNDTWYIGQGGSQLNILDLTYNDTAYFAATEEGIYYASIDSPNLADFSAWTRMNNTPYPGGTYEHIESYAENIFVSIMADGNIEHDTVYRYDGNEWYVFMPENTHGVNNINANNGKLVFALSYSGLIYDESLDLELKIYTYNPGNPAMNDAVNAKDGSIWVADDMNGLVKSFGGGFGSIIINPGGPYSSRIFSMASSANRVWVAPGGYNNTWAQQSIPDGAFRYYDENWDNFSAGNTSGMGDIRDIVTIAVNPTNPNQTYLGIFRNEFGLLEMNQDEITERYNTENSELQVWEAAGTIALVGLGYDSKGSLWSLCSGAEKLLAEKKSNGSWASYSLGGSASAVDCRGLFVDSYDQKWVMFRHTNSNPNYLAVYDETLAPNDRTRLLRGETGGGNIPGTNVFCVTQDQDDEIWIGTDEGIGIFYSPYDILTSNDYDCVRPLVNFDGYVQYLLETETVTAIAVDGDNRKWVGTERSGVFLLSQDGTEQIEHFTEDNSPLFSNQIIDIVINDDGEVFIGTANGIMGYKGTASAPSDSYSDVYAYPNPVKDGFDGWIAVKGLIKDSDVKITDINGTLIYATRSEGGQAVWNGKNFDGNSASPGVYLVFVSNEDGSETVVTKILIIK